MSQQPGPALRILRIFFQNRPAAVVLLALITGAASLDISIPFVTQRLVDSLVSSFTKSGRGGVSVVFACGAVIFVAVALTRVLRSAYNYYLFKSATGVEDTLKNAAFGNYLHLHALYHHNSNSGQIIGRIDRGGTAVFSILYDIIGQNLIPPLVVFLAVFLSLVTRSPWMAALVCLPAPVYVMLVRRLTARIFDIEQQVSEDFEVVARESYDVASNVMTVKKFSRESDEVENQRRLLHQARGTQYRGERLWARIEIIQTLISTFGRVSVVVASALMVVSSRCSVGEFVLFVALQDMAYQPVSQLSIIFPRLRRNMSRAERLFRVLDERPGVVDRPGAPPLAPLSRSIEFRNVWFRYAEEHDWTLRDVNLTVPAGATVALVGRSGSGKTTFVNLLLRAFDVSRGAVLIDGADIRDISQQSLRDQIALVPQEVDLFSRSIAENIAYGKAGASQAEIEAAARIAQAHDFILQTEDGYATVVGERGVKLSGGERQRIGIARAILRDPRILILDEATSHLDTENELAIQRATERLVRDRTSFVIAHRLSTVLRADLTVVFNGRGIEAVGTHEQLCQTSPTYRTLYTLHVAGLDAAGVSLADGPQLCIPAAAGAER